MGPLWEIMRVLDQRRSLRQHSGRTTPPGPVCHSLCVNWLDSGGDVGLFPPTEDQQQHKIKCFTSFFCCKVVRLNLNICAFSPWRIFLLYDLFLPQVLRCFHGLKGEASWFPAPLQKRNIRNIPEQEELCLLWQRASDMWSNRTWGAELTEPDQPREKPAKWR